MLFKSINILFVFILFFSADCLYPSSSTQTLKPSHGDGRVQPTGASSIVLFWSYLHLQIRDDASHLTVSTLLLKIWHTQEGGRILGYVSSSISAVDCLQLDFWQRNAVRELQSNASLHTACSCWARFLRVVRMQQDSAQRLNRFALPATLFHVTFKIQNLQKFDLKLFGSIFCSSNPAFLWLHIRILKIR